MGGTDRTAFGARMLFLTSSLSLRSKLLLMLLTTSLLSMGIVATIGYRSGRDALTAQAIDRLTSLRSSKKQQIEAHFRSLRSTFGVFSEDVTIISAMGAFRDGFNQLGRAKLSDARRDALEAYYRKEFLAARPDLGSSENALFETVWPRNSRAQELQALFIAENPFKGAERSRLIDHKVSLPYTLAHFTYHPWLLDMSQRLKLYDLMLVEAETGAIVYSVSKEPDLGNSLIDGPFANTNLGRLFRQVASEHRRGLVRMTDYDFYAPSNGIPAMFVATPIYSNFKFLGVLIGQLSSDEISRTLNGNNSWREDGLGDTGFAYVTGPSKLLRNDHRFFIENRRQFFERMKARGFPQSKLDLMDRQNTSILHMALNVEGVNRALQGETGVVVARSVAGEQSLQAFTPLSIPDLTWVLVARINESEILAPQNDFRRKVMIAASTLTLGSILLSMLLARFFLKPVNALLDGIRRLTSGSGAVTVAKTSNDEFGRLTDSFNQMAEQIRRRDEVISAKSTAYEQLLKRIFPDLVAERMRKGDAQVFDSVPNASVIYASVIGFVRLSESMPPDRALALINEIIDAFDTVAGAHGVEKVKTIGEHYVAACGLSTPRLDHAQRSINFADALSTALAEINARHGNRLSLRVGISSGPVQAGLIGSRKFVYDIWGRPLNHARRIVHDTDLGHVRITEDTYASLMSKDEMAELSRVPTKTFGELRTFGRRLKAELPTSEDMLADQATLKQAAE